MQNEKDYRPKHVEFDFAHDNSNMPESFGEFEAHEQCSKFIGSNLVSINQGMTVARHMDNFEKSEIRKRYNDILENTVPQKEHDLSEANINYLKAKRELEIAKENLNAKMNEAKALAVEVKRGTKEIKLDEMFTSRIAYKGQYYFYTFIDNELRLCAIRHIPESEKGEIWNQMAGNEEFIDNHFGDGAINEKYLKGEIPSSEFAEHVTGEKLSDEMKDFIDGTTETQEGTKE